MKTSLITCFLTHCTTYFRLYFLSSHVACPLETARGVFWKRTPRVGPVTRGVLPAIVANGARMAALISNRIGVFVHLCHSHWGYPKETTRLCFVEWKFEQWPQMSPVQVFNVQRRSASSSRRCSCSCCSATKPKQVNVNIAHFETFMWTAFVRKEIISSSKR